MSYIPEPYTLNKNKIKVELDLFNYATTSGLKIKTGVDKSDFAKMANLASLILDIDDLDTDKLKAVPIDLYKLSNVVVKKTVYDKLVKKVNVIQTDY